MKQKSVAEIEEESYLLIQRTVQGPPLSQSEIASIIFIATSMRGTLPDEEGVAQAWDKLLLQLRGGRTVEQEKARFK